MLDWVKGPCGTVPKDAFKAGRDNNGNIVYVGKAVHYVTEYQSEELPATVIASHTFAHASYGEKELDIDNYEVLCGYAFYWKPFIPHMPIPKGAVSTGKTVSDEDLFVVRVAHNKSDVIGKVKSLIYLNSLFTACATNVLGTQIPEYLLLSLQWRGTTE
jgi:hypothetical protein